MPATADARPGAWAPLRICRWPGCFQRQDGPYCQLHARISPRNHGGRSRQSRGLGAGWLRTVGYVLRRDGYRCRLQRPGCTVIATTADHIVPRSQGGSSDPTNLRASCMHCNLARGDRTDAPTGAHVPR